MDSQTENNVAEQQAQRELTKTRAALVSYVDNNDIYGTSRFDEKRIKSIVGDFRGSPRRRGANLQPCHEDRKHCPSLFASCTTPHLR